MAINYYPVIGELRREWLLWRSYKLNAISTVIMWGIIFPVLLVTIQNVAENAGIDFGVRRQTESLIGFLVWRLSVGVLVSVPDMIEQEARTGTWENVMVSSFISPLWLILLRMLALSFRAFLETALLGVILTFIFGLPITVTPAAILVALLILMGIWGVGLALAGLAMVYKAIGSITSIVANLGFMISGALVPINGLGFLFTILKVVFPLTWGIDVLRQVMVWESDMAILIGSREFFGLLGQTGLFITLGLFLFQWSLNKAKERGELGSY